MGKHHDKVAVPRPVFRCAAIQPHGRRNCGRMGWPLGHEPDANQRVDAQTQACGAAARGRSAGNMIGTVPRVCRNVKRWRNAAMALRWTAAGMMEAAKGFRRLKAYKHLPALRAALAAHQSKYVTQRFEHAADAA